MNKYDKIGNTLCQMGELFNSLGSNIREAFQEQEAEIISLHEQLATEKDKNRRLKREIANLLLQDD